MRLWLWLGPNSLLMSAHALVHQAHRGRVCLCCGRHAAASTASHTGARVRICWPRVLTRCMAYAPVYVDVAPLPVLRLPLRCRST